MTHITPVIRLSIGLTILVVSILLLAQALGLISDTENQQFGSRKQFAESLAAQINIAITRGDDSLLRDIMDEAIAHSTDLQSAGIRTNDGGILLETNRHSALWQGADHLKSTLTHMRFPLIINNIKRATFETRFKSPENIPYSIFGMPTFIALVIFVSISAFLGFWIYIRRALKHLDPSAVVPARVRNALNILAEGVLILDKREQIVLVNLSLLEKLNREEKYLIGKKASSLGWLLIEHQEDKDLPWLTALNTNAKQINVHVSLDQQERPRKIFRVNAVPILDPKGTSQGIIVVFDDITELEEKNNLLENMIKELAKSRSAIESKNRELTLLATKDPLTNCFNRRALYEYLENKTLGDRDSDGDYACIMADIDHFKHVNDTYGHGVGDDVIKMMAASIKEVVRDKDIVARMGGEEFCIILPNTSMSVANVIAERCREKIWSKVTSGVKITASFGVTVSKMGTDNFGEVIHQADEALYTSKENGRNKVTSWSAGIISKGS